MVLGHAAQDGAEIRVPGQLGRLVHESTSSGVLPRLVTAGSTACRPLEEVQALTGPDAGTCGQRRQVLASGAQNPTSG